MTHAYKSKRSEKRNIKKLKDYKGLLLKTKGLLLAINL